ncbi:GNAT family N-acetyltransferase [Longispora albida]|uniref:GNAT family N-acetyltransferase n=1 Tax=Longispora albida TaxID=203523 RepID=UPI0003767A0A|nr:GNAT family N-acetyltransferase [Longispora albida]
MEIVQLDLSDAAALEARMRLIAETMAYDVPDFPETTREECIDGLSHPWPGSKREYWIAVDGGELVGLFDLGMPTLDNVENSDVDLMVHPDHRRKGIGTALYAKAVERAKANGRKRIVGYAGEAAPDDTASKHGPGNAFALVMGAKRVHDEARRRWTPGVVSDEDLAAQLAEAWTHAEGYELVTWGNHAPDEIIDGVAYLDGRLLTDSPTGDLVLEKENYDRERIRAGEAAADARKRTHYGAGLVHTASGQLAAYTAIGMSQGIEWHGWQHNTIADPDHRGHRLGTVVKLENLARVRAVHPDLRAVDTWNAASNGYMIVINERMGFRFVDTWVNWQQEF